VLDGGETQHQMPSTVVDCTGVQPRIIREGAVETDRIMAVATMGQPRVTLRCRPTSRRRGCAGGQGVAEANETPDPPAFRPRAAHTGPAGCCLHGGSRVVLDRRRPWRGHNPRSDGIVALRPPARAGVGVDGPPRS
jgi:hypothetical protein